MSILSSLLRLGQGAPTQQIPTAVQTTEIAQEVAPFIKDILGKSQALYKQRMEEGFVPFEGQTLADVTADQLAAQEGLRGLVGSQAAGLQEAKDLTRAQTQQATAEALQSFMNPYQQAVTDIAKREAQERFEQETLPGLRKQAIDAGAFGGSRAAMRESQAQDAQARLLADIQAKGDLAAFQDARKAFEDQKTRERFAAEGLSGLTSAEFGARRAELGGLEAVGREEQQRQQQLLDESYKRFLDERRFPEQQLGQYQGFVAGASPFLKTTTTETSPQQFQPSPIASALGTITGGLGAYEQAQKVGLFSKEGGKVEDGEPGGLRGIMIKIIRAQRGKGGDPRSKRAERERTQMQQEDVTRMLEEMDMQAGGLIDLPIVERQRSGRIRGPQDLTPKVDEKEEKIKLLEQQLESLAKEKEAASVVTEQEPPVVTEGEDVNKIMTLDDPRVLGELPLKSVEARRTALENIAAAQEGRKLQAEQLMESQAAGLGEDRELAKQDARIKFLMGLSKGLLTGGTRGGILADLTRGGEEAVKATEGFSKEIRDLNQRERDILAQKMENDYNAEMAVLNTQLQQGALDMELFNSATQLLEANYRKGQRMIQDYTQSQAIADAIIAGVVDQTYETPEAGLKALEGARNIISEEDYIRAKNRINKFKPTTTKKDDNVDDRLKREPRITPSRG
jgi:molybdenum-dependent DNA-binding transcriptional regulator ModE